MKSEDSAPDCRLKAAFRLCALHFALCTLLGCTVAPRVVEPAAPSLDAGSPTSGVLAILPGQNYLVTALWVERYDALVSQYGTFYMPPLTWPRWIIATNGNSGNYSFIVTSDAMAAFAYLNILSKQHLGQ